jgi:hypothetical protein
MRNHLRLLAAQFALGAMLVRALFPAGWMPATASAQGTRLIICSVQGPKVIDLPGGKPAQGTPTRQQETCPFAVAAHATTAKIGGDVPAPTLIAYAPAATAVAKTPGSTSQFDPHSPRAPPRSA